MTYYNVFNCVFESHEVDWGPKDPPPPLGVIGLIVVIQQSLKTFFSNSKIKTNPCRMFLVYIVNIPLLKLPDKNLAKHISRITYLANLYRNIPSEPCRNLAK